MIDGPRSGAPDEQLEELDLRSSLTSLSRLSTRELGLEDMLVRIAAIAVRAIPGAEGAGLTLLEESRRDTVVATDPFVREVDEVQYSLDEGPCVDAARDGVTVMSGSLGGDPRWPRFGGHVARLGVHSAVSLPLLTTEGVVGAMNVYAHGKHVFDDRAAALGEVFASPAATAVQNAHALADTQRLVNRLQRAVDTQAVVEQAVGIMVARYGGTVDEARGRLRALSQHEHRKMVVLAERIVSEAARRARARRATGSSDDA